MSDANVVHLGDPCRRCAAAGKPVDLNLNGQPFATIFVCSRCVFEVSAELDWAQPIFRAMIAAGVPRETANDIMTLLLERWTP